MTLRTGWLVVAMIVILIAIGSGGFYMYKQQYQMAIRVTPDNENDREWPTKLKWFDAEKWLGTGQYIKISDYYLLNTQYIPVDNLRSYNITRQLQAAIRDDIYRFPAFASLESMSEEAFFAFMEGKLSYEYLRTGFDNETLEPTNDYFLFFFSYQEKEYEVRLLRVMVDHSLIFMPYGYEAGEKGDWHSIPSARYSYRDYLAGKPIK